MHVKRRLMRGALAVAAALSIITPAGVALAAPSVPIAAPTAAKAEPLPDPAKSKGKPTYGKPLKGSKAPKGDLPKPGGRQTRATACSSPCHLYASFYQYVTPGDIDGFGLRQEVDQPVVRSWDYFSLFQNAVQDTTNGYALEAGWVSNIAVNGDGKSRLFVYYRTLGGANTCWNCNFTPVVGAPVAPGDDFTGMIGDGVGFRLFWRLSDTGAADDGWHLYYAKASGATPVDIGYYAETLFTAGGNPPFTTPGLVQGFGEITCDQLPCQTGMGDNSLLAANRTGGSSWQFSGSAPPAASISTSMTDAEKWDGSVLTSTTFSFGGPGGFDKILSTTSPSADDCPGTGTGTNPSGLGAVCLYDTYVGAVPQGKLFQIDASAGTTCRANLGGNGISQISLTGVKKATVFNTNNCTGTGYQANHGRVALPAAYSNTAAFSYRVDSAYATCATGWPTTKPTC